MGRLFTISAMVLCVYVAGTSSAQAGENVSQVQVSKHLASQPLVFTKNMGQWPDSILFRADAGEAVMWFARDGIYCQYNKRIPRPRSGEEALAAGLGPRQVDPDNRLNQEADSIETAMIKAEFVGANPSVEVVGLEELEYKCNYFLGDDPAKWRTDAPNYSSITFRDLYPGVDASFGERYGRLECRLTAATPADLAQVKTEYRGDGVVTKESENTVSFQTAIGEKRFVGILPVSEAEPGGTPIVSTESQSTGISLLYSTYLGGGDYEEGLGIVVDGSGNPYVTGYTYSTDFPTQNPYQSDEGDGNADVFVTKLSAAGNSLLYSTYLGGGSNDRGYSIFVDGSGNAYVTGWTNSTDFPTQGPYQTDQVYLDVFVTKLSPTGNSLLYSTYLGGGNDDFGYGIDVDASGNAYVTGYTYSTNFPTQNQYQVHQGGVDAFVTKLSAAGNSLLYSTYLGGGSHDFGWDIAVDGGGNVYVTGQTYSTNFPTLNPYQTDQADWDVFVTKFSAAGNSLLYSTYLGGGGGDYGYGIALDGSGYAYVTGSTYSTDFPTLDPYQVFQGNYDVFMTKLSATGSNLVYSTYLGGGGSEEGRAIAVDGSGNVYVTGNTGSTNFPTQNPYQAYQGGADVFVTNLSAAGNSPLYSTYLGGGNNDYGYGISVDGSGNAYVTGYTNSTDFPTQNPYEAYQGNNDVLVTKLAAFVDTDFDGVPDDVDNCPTIYNPLQEDIDVDGVGDACDECTDTDGDGFGDPGYAANTCLIDNCPAIQNPGQEDLDTDGLGDACDPDIDGDGLLNTDETTIGSNPASLDSDSDGVHDYEEVFAEGGSVSNPADTDSDGLPNVVDPDDDGDGIVTVAEDINVDGNPANDDTDGDGQPNCLDYDDDGDGIPTPFEDTDHDGNPANDDTDSDGQPNYLDYDDDGDGIPTPFEDTDHDGNPANDDTDSDGQPNYLDYDDDGDSIPTPFEDTDHDGNPANDDTDSDGLPNYLDYDDDGDSIPTPFEDTDHDGNPANDDIDSDGLPNYLDLDSDDDSHNDGADNCPWVANPGQEDTDGDNIGNACDPCCVGRVGNANGEGEYPDEVTLGDIMLMVDVKFISGDCGKLPCVAEADVNQDGGASPTCEDYVTLGDIMTLVDFLFITGPENATLPDCL